MGAGKCTQDETNCLSQCFTHCYQKQYADIADCKSYCASTWCALPAEEENPCFECKHVCLNNVLALLPFHVDKPKQNPSPQTQTTDVLSDFGIPDFARSATSSDETLRCDKPQIKLKI